MKFPKLKITLLSLYIALSVFFSEAAAQQQQSSAITTKSPEIMYLGAVMEQNTINSNTHQVLDLIQDNIVISFSSINAKSQIIKAQKEPLYKAIDEAVRSANITKWQNKSFSFTLRELNSYKDIELFFGQNLDLKPWFSISEKDIKPKTLLIINLERIAFSVDIDLPEAEVFKTNTNLLAKYNLDNLIYTNTLSFGRRAIVIVESNIEVNDVKSALSGLIRKEQVSDRDKSILANCNYRVLLLGNNSTDLDSSQPIPQVIAYIEKEINADNFGLPISFGASYLKNNQLFNNKY